MEDVDVVIIGAGSAGLSAARNPALFEAAHEVMRQNSIGRNAGR